MAESKVRVARRTGEGGILIPSLHPDVMHEYGFSNNRIMYRRVLLDGTPDGDEGMWRALSDDEIIKRYDLRVPLLDQWLAENGLTPDVIEQVREARKQAKPKRGKSRQR